MCAEFLEVPLNKKRRAIRTVFLDREHPNLLHASDSEKIFVSLNDKKDSIVPMYAEFSEVLCIPTAIRHGAQKSRIFSASPRIPSAPNGERHGFPTIRSSSASIA